MKDKESLILHSEWPPHQIRKITGCACAGNAGKPPPPPPRELAIPPCISARASRFPLKSVVGKTFPAFLVHAQPAILRIWREVHGKTVDDLATQWTWASRVTVSSWLSYDDTLIVRFQHRKDSGWLYINPCLVLLAHSPHKGPVMRIAFPCHKCITCNCYELLI